ncbi:MAG: ATP-binding cassette domain-containing protein [Methanomicrobiales archaeon]|nr:ATP-binding cassette domain-containing protein [Methanomicrobiales archaeon]
MLCLQSLAARVGDFCIRDISLEVHEQEYFIIIGPTGAGKTVLLETLAGIHAPESGRIVLDGNDITTLEPRMRNMGMVYQDYMLFPHLTVRENIAFGLRQRGTPAPEREEAVQKTSRQLGISHLLSRYPETLSGGEQQRAALARALVLQPRILLLDEPMSALDSRTRAQISRELLAICRETKTTIIQITHHFEEVHALADRIAIMQEGTVIQTGTPAEVFLHPANVFAAEFLCIGNQIAGISRPQGRIVRVETNGQAFFAASEVTGPVIATLHSEDIIVSREPFASSARNCLAATVVEILPAGTTVRVIMDAGFFLTAALTRESCRDLDLEPGSRVYATFKASAVHLIATRPE